MGDDYADYGTALEPIEEDDATRKKPIAIADQIATDEKGRRRFHGAFTGGFSAGYFNTVGSKEGWTPSTFKSSRGDRANRDLFKKQNVLDFMDDEDKGAFGIAPQILRPTEDFTDKNESRGRKRPAQPSEGPIPGMAVLEQIIQPVKETVGIRILVKMGWRPGKGVGPSVQRNVKKPRIEKPVHAENDEVADRGSKMYGCTLPPPELMQHDSDSDNSEEFPEVEELLAPDDVRELLCNPKVNSFGLGYKGLDRDTLTSGQVDLYGGAKLKFRVENKNFNISGQAFGVGAFEDNDEDIYSREDMTQYDFALETPEERRRKKAKEDRDKKRSKNKENCIEGFKISTLGQYKKKNFPPPHLPPNFEPFHASKKSRFEPPAPTPTSQTSGLEEAVTKGLGRHNLTISERQVLIESDANELRKKSTSEQDVAKKEHPVAEMVTGSRVISEEPQKSQAEIDADIKNRIERLKKFTQVLQAYTKPEENVSEKAAFKPFMKNPEKQERYEKYLTLVQAGFSECLRDLQPPEMASWEREREKMEFERASKLYKPMNSILSSRFTSAKSHDISHLAPEKEVVKEKDPKEDPKVAAKMNLYGNLTHKVMEWHPDKLVCKRFNIPHPYPNSKFVGVKGDPSFTGSTVSSISSSATMQAQTNQVAALVQPAPKKSLFDNLDFSKPPPGLLPAESMHPPSSTDSPMESSENSESAMTAKPMLAFQKELTTNNSAQEEDIEPEIVRPPIDLFKEIFADSSDESEEEDVEPQKSKPSEARINQVNEQSQRSPDAKKDTPEVAAKRDDKVSDKSSRINYESTPQHTKESSTSSRSQQQRRVFDKIDLDRMQDHVRERRKSNEGFGDTSFTRNKSNDDKDDEEEEDVYGPLPPKAASSSGNHAPTSRQDPLKPTFIPRSSSSTYPSVSSTVMNHRPQSSSHDERKKDINTEEVIWVEKNALSDRSSKSHVKSKKRSSSKKSRRKSGKKEKHKSHKASKRHKHKKASRKHKSKGKHRESESSSGSSESDDDSGASSDSSVTINDSLDNKALLAKLKQITRSN